MADDQSRRSASTDTDVTTDAASSSVPDAFSGGRTGIPPAALATGATVVFVAILLRSGITNLVFVPVCAVILLLNPWVRVFLGLVKISEGDDEGKRTTSFDPIHIIRFLTGGDKVDGDRDATSRDARNAEAGTGSKENGPLDRSGAYAALRRMPASLRRPLSDLEELIIRDCVCSWYNYHSFGDPSLPNEARFSIDHGMGSLFHAMESVKSADVMTELLLAAASVLLVTLRYRRLYPKRAPIFANDQQRIQALREALDRVSVRHLRRDDADCDLMRILLREIVCKQIWNAICGIGEPDFINQQIIQWHEREQQGGISTAGQTATRAATNKAAYTTPGRPEAQQSVTPQAPNLSSRPSPQPSHAPSPDRMSSPVAVRKTAEASTSAASPTHEEAGAITKKQSGAEPRTTQPKAMTMPSPLARSAFSMSSTPTLTASTPAMEHPSPSITAETRNLRQLSPSKAASSPLAQHTRSPVVDPIPMSDKEGPSSGPKPVLRVAAPADVGEEAMTAWDDAWPMNVPPTAHQGMVLPESLRKSLKPEQESSPRPESQEGYRIGEGGLSNSRDSALSAQMVNTERSSLDSRSSRPLSPSARSNTSFDQVFSKPPSRVPSAASGGIPPAPDLAEVLSNKSVSGGFTALRDAFENFLERGGVANRSLFFSPPSAATVAPGEGIALLRLHVGLNAIARLVPGPDQEGRSEDEGVNEDYLYRDDAIGILQNGFNSLMDTDEGSVSGRSLREALNIGLQRLEHDGEARIREIAAPVERALWVRLHGLYDYFWKETCTKPAGARQATLGSSTTSGSSTPARESFSPEPVSANANWARNSREFRRQVSDFEGRASGPDAGELHYEPRKKLGKSPAAKTVPLAEESRAQPRAPAFDEVSTTVQQSSSVEGRPVKDEEAGRVSPIPPRPPTAKIEPGIGLTITVTDVSPNAERPKAPVDLRTYEVMIAVEGLASEAGGFVLLRHWKDFQQLDEELKRSASLPSPPTLLPEARGKSSESLTAELQEFLQHLLVSPVHMTSSAVQYFVDKARAGEEANADRMGILLDSLQLGKGLDFGKSLASGMVNTLQKGTRAAVTRAGSFPVPAAGAVKPELEREDSDTIASQLAHLPIGVRKSQGRTDERTAPNSHGLGIRSTAPSADPSVYDHSAGSSPQRKVMPLPPSTPDVKLTSGEKGQDPTVMPPSAMSLDDLDNFLSCIFAIADEAFSLSGGWTFRRGMLRVFEQIVRTQYWSSILGVFNNIAQSINPDQLGKWCTDIKVKFWPDESLSNANGLAGDAKAATSNAQDGADVTAAEALGEAVVEAAIEASQGGAEEGGAGIPPNGPSQATGGPDVGGVRRTLAQRVEAHRRAQCILLSHIPASSAIFMGPGGRQSCERALICVHEEICKPATSLDLVLTVVLKMCDIAAR